MTKYIEPERVFVHLKVKHEAEKPKEAPKKQDVSTEEEKKASPQLTKEEPGQLNRKARLALKKKQDKELYGIPAKKRIQSEKRAVTFDIDDEDEDEEGEDDFEGKRRVMENR